jgi:hypothetical protein
VYTVYLIVMEISFAASKGTLLKVRIDIKTSSDSGMSGAVTGDRTRPPAAVGSMITRPTSLTLGWLGFENAVSATEAASNVATNWHSLTVPAKFIAVPLLLEVAFVEMVTLVDVGMPVTTAPAGIPVPDTVIPIDRPMVELSETMTLDPVVVLPV